MASALLWLFWPLVAKSGDGEVDTVSMVEKPAEPTRVETVQTRRCDLTLTSEATGRLMPWRELQVVAEASGKVLELRYREGERAQAGAVLVRLDDREARIARSEAAADLLKAKAVYAANYGRSGEGDTAATAPPADPSLQELYEEGLIPRDRLQEEQLQSVEDLLSGGHQLAVRQSFVGLTQAEKRLERSQLALERNRLLAPFSGRVAELDVEEGQQVSLGDEVLLLLDDSKFKVDILVLGSEIVHLKPGAAVQVTIPALGGLDIAGQVETVNPRIDPEKGTGRVTAVVPNRDPRLVSGLFCNVEVEVGRLRDRVILPTDAVLSRQGRNVVLVIKDGRSEWRYVETGARSNRFVEALSGVEPGEEVAISGHFTLAHGSRVITKRTLGSGCE